MSFVEGPFFVCSKEGGIQFPNRLCQPRHVERLEVALLNIDRSEPPPK